MISKATIQRIAKEAKPYFRGASGCHDWTHIERVRSLALQIGQKEKADLPLLEIAVLLHDLGRKEEMDKGGRICHAKRSVEIAAGILQKYDFRKQDIAKIIHCIKSHRYRRGRPPKSIESRVLFDADKLDSIGAVGVARAFLFAGSAGSGNLYTGNEDRLARYKKDYCFTKEDSAFLEYKKVLKKVKDKMLTQEGKRIARMRHKFMYDFFKRFWQEVRGRK